MNAKFRYIQTECSASQKQQFLKEQQRQQQQQKVKDMLSKKR